MNVCWTLPVDRGLLQLHALHILIVELLAFRLLPALISPRGEVDCIAF